jgi:hypothetical protein
MHPSVVAARTLNATRRMTRTSARLALKLGLAGLAVDLESVRYPGHPELVPMRQLEMLAYVL